ncbi:lysophospholipase L1-like esterase [Agromyces terreus]|uniref:Lysophospholipase L1-like esterase n=1 Tax=Agromyces terreus TaxID=424795 RepID=A0A9X2H675_9MICO|nr:SGNH/GDSL hydrolase family protein [Agromyces terreus]MCP2370774.1 lysophospholipase L1-like esterase [Agromyces terreus]
MVRHRSIRTALGAVVATLALVAASIAGASGAQAAAPPPPSIAALGDSITQATDACGYKDCPAYSWSTGTSSSVKSHATRLKAAGATTLAVYNNAVTGSKAANLLAQAQKAVAQQAQYVTVEIGANDACTTTVAGMTPTATFSASVLAALQTINQGTPTAKIFVASIPNLKQMWSLSKSKAGARLVWAAGRVCQSMLAKPTSTAAADNARRDQVQARVVEFNTALAAACAAVSNCTFDGNAVANLAFTSSHISVLDYFHPSIAGQAKLAEVTWPLTPYGAP